MAQVLKKELKEKIILAARQEFLEHGYKNASMREIAKKADMTVGNLYRYFKNKEEINLYIVAPTYKKMEIVIDNLLKKEIQIETRVFESKPDEKEIKNIFEKLVDSLLEIYKADKNAFKILFLYSRISENIIEWFKKLFLIYLQPKFILSNLSNDKEILASAYAKAIFKGMQELLNSECSDKMLKQLLYFYLCSYLKMFDNNENDLIG